MNKHLAQIATLDEINLCKSNFDLNRVNIKDGSSLAIAISIDHEFGGSDESSFLHCEYNTIIEGINPSDEKIFTLDVSFIAKYLLSEVKDWEENEVTTFVDKCVNFHVWPYMREHVHYMSAKANIPTVLLPLLPSAHERNQ